MTGRRRNASPASPRPPQDRPAADPDTTAPAPGAPDRAGALRLTAPELTALVVEEGGRAFHARSILRWILERGEDAFDRMTDLPRPLARALADRLLPLESRIEERRAAPDGTTKLLLRLRDGERIETVWMPGSRAASGTVCVSTQVGCAMACRFCASGLAGVVRNLAAHEIVEQILQARRVGPVGRLVVMGIGEPTLNLEALLSALDTATRADGLGISARRITISTVGSGDRIRALAAAERPYTLAVSLHAPDDVLRRELIPTSGKVTLDELLAASADYFRATGREVTFEYVLLGGVNDRPAQARALARLLEGSRGSVNLIPYNPIPGASFARPSETAARTFRDCLRRSGIPATIRWSKGVEADAACGQLRIDAREGGRKIR